MFPPVGLVEEKGMYQRKGTRRGHRLLARESRLLDRRLALRLTWMDGWFERIRFVTGERGRTMKRSTVTCKYEKRAHQFRGFAPVRLFENLRVAPQDYLKRLAHQRRKETTPSKLVPTNGNPSLRNLRPSRQEKVCRMQQAVLLLRRTPNASLAETQRTLQNLSNAKPPRSKYLLRSLR
jgi:hypothetical protein